MGAEQPLDKVGHWFGPMAAIRPYVFQKCFTLMLGFDLLVLMVERGARYGTDVVPFNVAHFSWLDTFHRAVLPGGMPSDVYYVGLLCITSFLCFCLFYGGHRPWLMAIVGALFTYCWAMSRLDSYLHHYMLSLVMLCLVFFPRVDARDLRDWLLQDPQAKNKHHKSSTNVETRLSRFALVLLGLALAYRFTLSQSVGLADWQRWMAMSLFGVALGLLIAWRNPAVRVGLGPYVSAWSLRLLMTTVGVIYMFAAVAKMDAEWCGGHTLKAVGATERVLRPVAQFAGGLGISEGTFWSVLATLVIPLEIALGGCYLLAVWQDEPQRIWLRRLCFSGWLLAIGLHLNNEMMNLIIQWFGYYMLLWACLLLMPARVLLIAGQVFIWPECWIRETSAKLDALQGSQKAVLTGLIAILALAGLLAFAVLTLIPGTMLAASVLGAGFVVAVVLSLIAWEKQRLMIVSLACAASLTMVVAIVQSNMRFDYFDLRGKTLQLVGRHEEATRAMETALLFSPPSDAAAAELLTNLGLSQRSLGLPRQAEKAYRAAIGRNPREFLAHYNLANLLVDEQRLREAEKHYLEAIAIKSDNSDAMLNLGNVLEFQGRVKQAIAYYEQAAAIEPDAQDIQHFLEQARAKLAEQAN